MQHLVSAKKSWLLPEGIEELLPAEAKHLEHLRHTLLSVFECWGYDLVIPPFIDFVNSLLIGAGHDLDLQTFKLTDQISGELLGIRADMTPQVARIDAHNLKYDWPTRLCYVGTVLHTRGNPLEKNRSPMQIGAELYGHHGLASDLEIVSLMLEMLAISGVQNVHLDLGHVGIYRALTQQINLTSIQEAELFEILQRKAKPELLIFIDQLPINTAEKTLLLALPELNGGDDVLAKAAHIFNDMFPKVKQALADLELLAKQLTARFPNLIVSFDLAELRGYHYHTGIIFAAFVPSMGREIARGGRYDNIGAVFGRERPATGFSADLKQLSTLSKQVVQTETREAIFAPWLDEQSLHEHIRDLRAQGRRVVQQLPEQIGGAKELACTATLEKENQKWVVKPLM